MRRFQSRRLSPAVEAKRRDQRLRKGLQGRGWATKTFTIVKTINGEPREAISHKMDHVKSFANPNEGGKEYTLALEIEWNNKDPFFDRDLENFKRLHADGAISVGIIVTRGRSLHASNSRTRHSFRREAKD